MIIEAELVRKRFAIELVRCCGSHFKSFPSNEQFARDLCLSSKYSLKVSREAVRKWFKGEAFPDLDNFIYLIKWLKLDVSKIYQLESSHKLENTLKAHEYSKINIEDKLTSKEIQLFLELVNEIKKSN